MYSPKDFSNATNGKIACSKAAVSTAFKEEKTSLNECILKTEKERYYDQRKYLPNPYMRGNKRK
ncbi:MAG TPA: hypothetical protein DCM73_02355 [Clostridiales bacterium]|nr:hypothetical protein [Clostridiales bacterium]